ncbi:MAG: GNAT family N-acetyltransferase [Streptococcaceae bacterium]|jgi:predicted GNAT family N-acyltransferase|nr:GNAT family N-acetyltransferase [Streptococcaceae bacterium]
MKVVNSRDTMNEIYLDAVRIRHRVFVEGQGVPQSIEIDKYEAYAVHFVLYDDQNIAQATARLLPNEEEKTFTMQRTAVLPEVRGLGFGKMLVKEMEKFAIDRSYKEINLHAQVTAKSFYEQLGYVAFGDEHEIAGMMHVDMKKDF